MKNTVSEILWQDRKRTIFGLPWSFTRYFITDEKVLLDIGFLSRTEEEIRLYRITDVTLKRSFCERIFGLGTIHCCSGDKSTPEFDIKHIKNSRETKEMLSDLVEKARNERRVAVREFVDADTEHED
jgi:uncharacterized membrane protein YdbT with pleckstrin-like domain